MCAGAPRLATGSREGIQVADFRVAKIGFSLWYKFRLFCAAKTTLDTIRMKHLFFTLLLCATVMYVQAQKRTVSGYVTDAESGEKLIGARVFDPKLKAGSLTNAYGFYSITVEADTLALSCNYIGYESSKRVIVLKGDTTIHFALLPEGVNVETVEITDEVDIAEEVQMSSIDVPIETIKKIPALMGEVDVIRAIQLLPGVQSGNEGSTGMYVRGGGPDQNLILLDGVPVYNVSHLFGFFSVFPADAISNVNLVKGGFPARYGGRLSSVLDISLKDGNMKEFHGEAGIGLVSSKLTLEGPIIKDKTSFMVSARRTYIDILAQPIIRASAGGDATAGYYFYDGVAKVNHKFSDKDRLYLSFYGGRDKAYFKEDYENTVGGTDYRSITGFKLGWGNLIGAARWNHLFSNKLFGNLTLTYSNFDFGIAAEQENRETSNGITTRDRFALGYDSGIRDWSARMDFDWFASPNHLVRFGGYGTYHTFTPGVSQLEIVFPGFEVDTTFGAQIVNATEVGVYIEDDFKIGTRHKMNVGVHASGFLVNGTTYGSVQPRLAHRMFLNENWAFKSSVTSMAQYVHLLTNVNVGLPTDLWVPATENITPQRSYQGAIGLARSFRDQGLELSVEGYYKHMTGLVEYKEGAAFLSDNSDWQTLVTQGEGNAYGMEVLLQRKKGKTNGWIGYTLAWTNRQFDELNKGEVFSYKYDRRHDVSLVLTHTFSEKVDAGLTWVYGTGNAVTLPIASYMGMSPMLTNPIGNGGSQLDHVTERNGFRMRAYHRLDLGVNLHKQHKKWLRTWSFSVYNAYSRRNPFFLYWDSEFNTGKPILKQVSLFPIIPSVSFHAKF